MSDNTLERLVYLIKCWYICRKKLRKECNLLEMSVG